MIRCVLCDMPFDPEALPDSPDVQAGLVLTAERYHDTGRVCDNCLASRGRLAMMYDPDCRR